MEEQLEEVQQVLLYARAQRSSKQKEQPGQTFGPFFVSAAGMFKLLFLPLSRILFRHVDHLHLLF